MYVEVLHLCTTLVFGAFFHAMKVLPSVRMGSAPLPHDWPLTLFFVISVLAQLDSICGSSTSSLPILTRLTLVTIFLMHSLSRYFTHKCVLQCIEFVIFLFSCGLPWPTRKVSVRFQACGEECSSRGLSMPIANIPCMQRLCCWWARLLHGGFPWCFPDFNLVELKLTWPLVHSPVSIVSTGMVGLCCDL